LGRPGATGRSAERRECMTPQIPVPVATIGLLLMSNVFMTFAW
jgi:hypothetical protein